MQNLKLKAYNALKQLEKYAKTDMVYLAKSGSWVGIGLVISGALSFLLAIAFANLLEPRIYGEFKYVISIISILYAFTLTGMATAINKSVAKGFEGDFIKSVKLKIKWGLFGALGAFILALYYFINGNNTLALAFAISAPFIPLMESFLLFNAFLGGRKEFKTQTKFSISISIIATLSMIATLFLAKNLVIIIAVYFLSYTLLRLFFLAKTIKKYNPNKKKEQGAMKYGKHLSFMDAISIIAGNIDKFLVFHFLGAAQLAIYAFALTPIIHLKFFNKILKPLAMPKFAAREKQELKPMLTRKILIFAGLMAIIAGLYIIAAPYLFKIFFPKYLESIPISQIASLILIASAAIIPTSILKAHAQIKKLYILQISESITSIILLTAMTIFFGLIGLVVARIIVQFINLGLSGILTKKYLES